ncbi:hypothetical protein RMSM_05022 [Rhodopirellula maiorica SM1]|uniref:Uncharacterized protein n=1 Tax=Rhodopirellula maiorica SM1 TaxID=1265738 RepID=M5RRQ4_9BACT|nr:hypothetical protein RMSM_05022 [Rhodopirellula maiorica SM1]
MRAENQIFATEIMAAFSWAEAPRIFLLAAHVLKGKLCGATL